MGRSREIEDPTLSWVLYDNLEITFTCRDCGKDFNSESLYLKHFNDSHSYNIKISNGGEQQNNGNSN